MKNSIFLGLNPRWLSVLVFTASVNLWAQAFNPTSEEISQYKIESLTINDNAAQCLNDTWEEHINFFDKYGVSKFYGDRHPDWKFKEKRLEIIRKVGAPDSIVKQQIPMSCVGLTLRCLGRAFKQTENEVVMNMWSRIEKHVYANGTQGDYLIRDLQKLGWKVLYWNPDPSKNEIWDIEDKLLLKANKVATPRWDTGEINELGENIFNIGWGYHQTRYAIAMGKRSSYMGIHIDDRETLVGFGANVPESFKLAPFFVGIAHAGYHVFSGAYGEVIEAHSMRPLDSRHNLEKAPFNPMAGQAPQWTNSEKYRSGIIAIPPEIYSNEN